MNKTTKIVVGVVIIGLLGAGGFVLSKNKDSEDTKSAQTNQTTDSSTDASNSGAANKPVTAACDIFSASDISGALGVSFVAGSEASITGTSSDGLKSAQCEWFQTDEATVGIANAFSVTLIVENYSTK